MDCRARLEWLLANFAELEERCEAADGYELTAETCFEPLFAGIAAPVPMRFERYDGDRRGVALGLDLESGLDQLQNLGAGRPGGNDQGFEELFAVQLTHPSRPSIRDSVLRTARHSI